MIRAGLHDLPWCESLETGVDGVFPNENAVTRLAGTILLEQKDERSVQRVGYMSLEAIVPAGQ